MKKFIITLTLLFLVCSVFADNWITKGKYNSREAGAYTIYWNKSAENSFTDSAATMLTLLNYYNKTFPDKKMNTEVYTKEQAEANRLWILDAVKNGVYEIIEEYEKYAITYYYCSNGTVIDIVIYN